MQGDGIFIPSFKNELVKCELTKSNYNLQVGISLSYWDASKEPMQ